MAEAAKLVGLKRSSDTAGLSPDKEPKRLHTVSSLLQILDAVHLAPTPAVESHLLQILDNVTFDGDSQQSSIQKQPATNRCTVPGCGKTFSRPQDLKRHTKSVHQGVKFPCHVKGCTKVFTWQSDLIRHTKSEHQGVRYSCPVEGCMKDFTWQSDLSDHTKSQHLGVTYSCPVEGCTKVFAYSRTLNRHTKSEHQSVKYSCPVEGCGEVFTDQSNLNRHTKSEHLGIRYSCPVEGCGEVLTSQSHLKRHTENVHPQNPAEFQEKKRQLQQFLADKQARGLCTATKNCQNPPAKDSFRCSHHEKSFNIITKELQEKREAGKLSESSIKHPDDFELLLQQQEVSLRPEVKAELQLLAQGFNNSHPASSRTFTQDAEWIRISGRYLPLDITIMRSNGEILVSTRVDYGMSITDLQAQCDARDFIAKRTIRKVYGHASMTWGKTPSEIVTILADAGVTSDAIF